MTYLAEVNPTVAARRAVALLAGSRRPSVRSITKAAERLTGKQIRCRVLRELSGHGATGLWFECADHHVIFAPPPASTHHITHVKLHEIAHLTYAHLRWASPPPLCGVAPETLPIDDLIAVAHAHRFDLRGPGEQAAELFAYYALDYIRAHEGSYRRHFE